MADEMNGQGALPPDPPIKQVDMMWAVQRRHTDNNQPFVQIRISHNMGVSEFLIDCDFARQLSKMLAEAATGLSVV